MKWPFGRYCGGINFLGIGAKYHPLPWSTLNYDESKGGAARLG